MDAKMNINASDPVIGFTYKPNALTYEKGREYNALYQINSLGLRDREYGPKQEGIFRVLLLGDSFSVSHGLPIEDSLSRQMERALQSVADGDGMPVKFEVINAAAGGYSPYNYWKAYIRWAPLFHPDVVIVGLSPDDYDSSTAELNYLVEDGDTIAMYRDGQLPIEMGDNYIRKIRKWLSWNSELYILLRNFFYYNDLVGRVSIWFSSKNENRIIQLQQFVVPQPENMVKAWATSFSYLDKLYESTIADKVVLIMVPIPLKEEIDESVYKRSLAASGLNLGQTDINQPLIEISNFCNARHIPLFDPRPAIKARHLEVPCYFVYDGHWIAEGIRVATASIARQWRALRLPPWDKNAPLKENKNLN
ncbi:MAG: hypothetical protein ABFD82_20220 [Syntrophaceae bacterium]